MDCADLELTLRRQHTNKYAADLRLRVADSAADSDLASNIPLHIDPQILLPFTQDTVTYGQRLTAMLFTDPRMREAWAKAQGFIQGANTALRVRLRIDITAEDLHSLRWETLQDPVNGLPLGYSERMLFSRYLDTGDLTRVPTFGRSALRSVVVVASPLDLAAYDLAPIDVAHEVTRIHAALGDIPVTVLNGQNNARVTLNNIIAALRTGYPILYLVCHGMLRNGTPYLWLEREDGHSDQVAGAELVQRIGDLRHEQRPLLVVLASCQSAGTSHAADVLAALGPQLARIGVAAVVGMQGAVPIATVERLMPRFFQELIADGQIDRALARARADLNSEHPWWMPVLFMRVRDGRLWATPTDESVVVNGQAVGRGLHVLADLMQLPIVYVAVASFRAHFQNICEQIVILGSYKLLHDLFQRLEDCTMRFYYTGKRPLFDETMWDELELGEPEFATLADEVVRVAYQSHFATAESLWVKKLERSCADLRTAIEIADLTGFMQALVRISGQILGREPSRVNARLIASTRTLRLSVLVEALIRVRACLMAQELDAQTASKLDVFSTSITDLSCLDDQLTKAVTIHDTFQELDNELRRIAEQLDEDVAELELAWGDVKVVMQRLCAGNPSDWAEKLVAYGTALETALMTGHALQIRRAFRRYRAYATQSFNRVDHDLLQLCDELQKVGTALSLVLRMIS